MVKTLHDRKPGPKHARIVKQLRHRRRCMAASAARAAADDGWVTTTTKEDGSSSAPWISYPSTTSVSSESVSTPATVSTASTASLSLLERAHEMENLPPPKRFLYFTPSEVNALLSFDEEEENEEDDDAVVEKVEDAPIAEDKQMVLYKPALTYASVAAGARAEKEEEPSPFLSTESISTPSTVSTASTPSLSFLERAHEMEYIPIQDDTDNRILPFSDDSEELLRRCLPIYHDIYHDDDSSEKEEEPTPYSVNETSSLLGNLFDSQHDNAVHEDEVALIIDEHDDTTPQNQQYPRHPRHRYSSEILIPGLFANTSGNKIALPKSLSSSNVTSSSLLGNLFDSEHDADLNERERQKVFAEEGFAPWVQHIPSTVSTANLSLRPLFDEASLRNRTAGNLSSHDDDTSMGLRTLFDEKTSSHDTSSSMGLRTLFDEASLRNRTAGNLSSHDDDTSMGLRTLFDEKTSSSHHNQHYHRHPRNRYPSESFEPGLPTIFSDTSLNESSGAVIGSLFDSEHEAVHEDGPWVQQIPSTASLANLSLHTHFDEKSLHHRQHYHRHPRHRYPSESFEPNLPTIHSNTSVNETELPTTGSCTNVTTSWSLLGNLFDSQHAIHEGDLSEKERKKVLIAKDFAQYCNSDDERTHGKSTSLSTFVHQIESLFDKYRMALAEVENLKAQIAELKKKDQE